MRTENEIFQRAFGVDANPAPTEVFLLIYVELAIVPPGPSTLSDSWEVLFWDRATGKTGRVTWAKSNLDSIRNFCTTRTWILGGNLGDDIPELEAPREAFHLSAAGKFWIPKINTGGLDWFRSAAATHLTDEQLTALAAGPIDQT